MIPFALVAASAVLMWAAFPPVGFGALAFVAPVPLFIGIRMVERAAYAVALGFFFVGTVPPNDIASCNATDFNSVNGASIFYSCS